MKKQNNNYHIVVYALEGCPMCGTLMSSLNAEEISYSSVICKDTSEECDNLEDYINCYTYPIVVISNKVNSTKTYICVKSRLDKKNTLRGADKLECYGTIAQVIDRIKKFNI